MKKTLKLGTIAGIRLQVHWTFAFIIAWVIFASLTSGGSLLAAATSVAFVLVLFGCVVLHELGHALAARIYGIPTRDITLLPIGGVARLERMPRKPSQELVVALAGPAVNVVIIALLLAFLLPTVGFRGLAAVPMQSGGFLQQILIVNVMLVVFNMLPAFPLDGGRVLRALFAMFTSYGKATRLAAGIGQVCAVGLGLLGLVNPFLFVIAVFIFFGAMAEARQVTMHEQFGRFKVRDGMLRTFRAVTPEASLRGLAEQLLDGPQRDYPVVEEGSFIGMLSRDDLLAGLHRTNAATVADVMNRDVVPIEESEQLISALERASTLGRETLPVTNADALTGLLDGRQAFELVKARSSLAESPGYAPTVGTWQRSPNLT